jgi:hypothetical protein
MKKLLNKKDGKILINQFSNIMSLEEIVDIFITDKNTTHSYLSLYEQLLVGKKEIII